MKGNNETLIEAKNLKKSFRTGDTEQTIFENLDLNLYKGDFTIINEGLSQEQLAERIGVSRQAITKWETKRGLPDVENMIILAELFKLTLDEVVLSEVKRQESKPTVYESETAYDIDTQKHFDINLGGVLTITLKTGSDEKIRIRLSSETLADIGSLFKIKLDEKKGRLDVDLQNKKGVSRFEAQESVDITLLLPEKFTEHAEVSAGVKELYVEDLRLERLEYDGVAEKVYIRDCMGKTQTPHLLTCTK